MSKPSTSDHFIPSRADVYARITAEIIAAIERGAGQWRMPWHHDGAATHRPVNAVTAKPYRGMNILALWAAAEGSHFATGLWGTNRQWVRRESRLKGVDHGSLSSVQLYRRFSRIAQVIARCEARDESPRRTASIAESRARRRSDGRTTESSS